MTKQEFISKHYEWLSFNCLTRSKRVYKDRGYCYPHMELLSDLLEYIATHKSFSTALSQSEDNAKKLCIWWMSNYCHWKADVMGKPTGTRGTELNEIFSPYGKVTSDNQVHRSVAHYTPEARIALDEAITKVLPPEKAEHF